MSGSHKDSLLDHFAKNAHWVIVKLFMEDDGRDYYFGRLGDQQRVELLCYFIRSKDLDIAKFLVEKGTKVNNSDKYDKKPIYYAADNEHWSIVEFLLRKNADFSDLSKEQKFSLLVHSTKNISWDIVELFEKDINRNNYFDRLFGSLNDQQKMRCLYYLISVGDLDITKSFIEKLIKEN